MGWRPDRAGRSIFIARQYHGRGRTVSIGSSRAIRARCATLDGMTDWVAIAQLYATLIALTGSPAVAINRAVAHAATTGANDGLVLLDLLAGDPRLAEYQPYWAARAGDCWPASEPPPMRRPPTAGNRIGSWPNGVTLPARAPACLVKTTIATVVHQARQFASQERISAQP